MRKKKVFCEKQPRYKNQILTGDKSDLRLKQSRQEKQQMTKTIRTVYKNYSYNANLLIHDSIFLPISAPKQT